ncbi:protein farnesyltransferase subunit beta-like isoform X2 [Stegodyphus dumicola]|uniref:protein farnesyltransferase subunit beta-like isoform X2 n=1 Tax=Stegodyphus dumicola TaxID=202533 RepID=UPI0015AB4B88|nr:protein farnesyltransferase subunit beta-like isoform X2 [Stegodyphus dumicola]
MKHMLLLIVSRMQSSFPSTDSNEFRCYCICSSYGLIFYAYAKISLPMHFNLKNVDIISCLVTKFHSSSPVLAVSTVRTKLEKLLQFLLRMKKPDGSFTLHKGSESDIRGVYCALSVAKLTNIWCPELIKGTAHWVSRCQTYEGGFGGVPYMEAHGGYTFCGFASLVLMGQENLININNLLRWLVHRQMKYEGGFQGRTNKLVDSCYSFWQGGTFPLMHRVLCLMENETMSTDNWLFNQGALQEYLLVNCQTPHGGLIDKPGKNKDYYHTCYALSGLSIAQHFASGHIGKIRVVGNEENELCPTHPVYNLCVQSALEAVEYFKNLPVPSVPSEYQNDSNKNV